MSQALCVHLGEVCDIVAGQHIEASLYGREPIGSPYLTGPADFGDRIPIISKWTESPKVFGKASDVLLTVKGAGVGKSNYGCDAAIGRQLMALRPQPSLLNQEYLFHFIRKQEAHIASLAQGATVPGIGKGDVEGLSIPLPPLPEQRRIAAILDQAEALRSKRRAALAKLDTLAKSIFIEMFGDLRLNPMHWPFASFNEVCETRLGRMLDQKRETGAHSRPYLRNANVQWFSFDLSDVYKMDFAPEDRETYLLRDGDLLICEGGQPGRCAVWRGQIPECYFQKALHRGRPKQGRAHADYLAWMMWFMVNNGQVGDHVTSATIAHLTGEKLKAMPIPLPPFELQVEFSKKLDAVRGIKELHQTSHRQIDSMFSSLQHRAFRGEL